MVKNEEKMLGRCLSSIQHLVDEIIVVDTGSSDNTVKIAESFGAKIFHHAWEQDFSKHRNQSIGYATGDWFIIIDADEEMDARHLTKNELKKQLHKVSPKVHCLLMKVLDKNRQGKISNVSKSARIFRKRVGVEYRGIVHNTAHYTGQAADSELSLYHYGYALAEEQMQAKFKRTSSLLHKRIENDPDDFTAYFYLCQVYMEMKEQLKGIEYGHQCLGKLPSQKETNIDISFYYSLFHTIAMGQITLNQYDLAVATVRKGLELLPDEIDLYYDLAYIGYLSNNFSLTIEGSEGYLRVLEEFRSTPMRAGTRFIFSTSKEIQATLEYWLMTAYLATKKFDRFHDLWHLNKNHLIDKQSLQKELLTNLERSEAWDMLEKIVAFLFDHRKKGNPALQKLLLEHAVFFARAKSQDERLETLISEYLELITEYKEIPTDTTVIIAEFLLKKKMGDFFLDLTMVLFEKRLTNKIKTIKDTADTAHGYSLISAEQPHTKMGLLTASICLNIAWNLTGDKQYLVPLTPTGASNDSYGQADIITKRNNVSSTHSRVSHFNETKGFRAAFEEIDITPTVSKKNPVSLQGTTANEKKACSISSPLKLQMLLIEDKNRTKLFFVTADLFGFENIIANQIKKAGEPWGIEPEGIILNASGTNHAPGTVSYISKEFGQYDKNYAQRLTEIIIHQLTMLHGALEETSLCVGNTEACIGTHKRFKKNGPIKSSLEGEKGYDRHTPFLIVDINKTAKRIILINHGCLPTILDTGHGLSSDFPGLFRNELIHKGNIDHVMYLQGAAGDTKETSEANNGLSFSKTELDAQKNGILLAEAINKALESELIPLEEAVISYGHETMYLPLKKLPDMDRIKQLKNDKNTSPNIREWASRLLAAYPTGNFPNAFTMDIQIASIGKKATFICLPATPVAELGKKLKQMTDSPGNAFILGNTNGLGYIPDEETINQQGYEQETYPYFHMMPYLFEKGIEKEITAKAQRCLNKIHDPSRASGCKDHEEKATIWDFTRFKHQKFPGHDLSSAFFKKISPVAPLINKKTPISSMGSCFARNIAIFLQNNGYNYLVTEFPPQQASAHWDQVVNTACMRQIFEYTFSKQWNPLVRWWSKEKMVQDPFRRQILYNKNTCEADFQKHKKASYKALANSRVIILTLGLTEIWRDRRDQMAFYQVPSPKKYDPEIHEFYLQTTQDCINDLERIHTLTQQNNPEASIIVTVSPVPLIATFRKGVDPVTATGYSKATLRVAAESFANIHENVYYFPSYEIITSAMEKPYEPDNRHVTQEAIKEMMEIFKTWFMV